MPRKPPARHSRRTAKPAKTPKKHASKARSAKARAPTARSKAPARGLEPNLLITIEERRRLLATAEVQALLERLGHPAKVLPPMAEGLLGLRVEGDAKEVVAKVKMELYEHPMSFHHTHRWIPIEDWGARNARELERFAERCRAEIGPDDTWRIQVEQHGTHEARDELITALAKKIDNPHVDLDHAQKTVLLEVVGSKAGVAVVGEAEVLSVDRSLRDDFVSFEVVG